MANFGTKLILMFNLMGQKFNPLTISVLNLILIRGVNDIEFLVSIHRIKKILDIDISAKISISIIDNYLEKFSKKIEDKKCVDVNLYYTIPIYFKLPKFNHI
jgi:hypothetical protein